MKTKTICLTKLESAVLQGLLFEQLSYETKDLLFTDEDRELAAELLRNFVGLLTRKLLGPPAKAAGSVPNAPAKSVGRPALPGRQNFNDYLN
jgi:hypothetical protein